MNCLYCYRDISTEFQETTFDCRWHDNWDVKFCWYNSINSATHKENESTLYHISLISTDDKYCIGLHILSNTTIFLKSNSLNEKFKIITTIPRLEYITPDNASQWMERILKLKAFL